MWVSLISGVGRREWKGEDTGRWLEVVVLM
jgi:hypothetical protein